MKDETKDIPIVEFIVLTNFMRLVSLMEWVKVSDLLTHES